MPIQKNTHCDSASLAARAKRCNHWANKRVNVVAKPNLAQILDDYDITGDQVHLD
jgi:hypothetical protein